MNTGAQRENRGQGEPLQSFNWTCSFPSISSLPTGLFQQVNFPSSSVSNILFSNSFLTLIPNSFWLLSLYPQQKVNDADEFGTLSQYPHSLYLLHRRAPVISMLLSIARMVIWTMLPACQVFHFLHQIVFSSTQMTFLAFAFRQSLPSWICTVLAINQTHDSHLPRFEA